MANHRPTDGAPSRVPWPPILLVLAVAGGVAIQRAFPLAWPGLDDTAARFIGLGIGALGLALILWAAMTLWRHQTTVLPNRATSALVTDGPYRWRRNPIYVGDAMILLGLAELSKNIWFALLVPVFVALVTWLAILPEERHLEARYGEAWRAYRDRTRRWI
ncbi:MAG: isoprenylcysteine carboxylmethyltransferase family protein [Hyphomicrobiaceae bacterium]